MNKRASAQPCRGARPLVATHSAVSGFCDSGGPLRRVVPNCHRETANRPNLGRCPVRVHPSVRYSCDFACPPQRAVPNCRRERVSRPNCGRRPGRRRATVRSFYDFACPPRHAVRRCRRTFPGPGNRPVSFREAARHAKIVRCENASRRCDQSRTCVRDLS